MTTHHESKLFINEGIFGIFDNGEVPVETADWSAGLIAPMAAGAMVRTGINTGNVRVEVETGAPASTPGEWEEEAAALVWSPTGSLRIESVVEGPGLDLPILSTFGPGWYEVAVKARGRRENPDASILDSAEAYQVRLRPAPGTTPPVPGSTSSETDPDEEARRRRLLQE
ncbi:hypothetical protein ACGFZK_07525 [Streptomyces sp. NPDC048257]|uniref:hypothetical protein n=1 Tax=Streptomyces sp. NPDC048257 TaxID=3365526 RepID=UPI003717D03F